MALTLFLPHSHTHGLFINFFGSRRDGMAWNSQSELLSALQRCSGMRALKAIHAQTIVLDLARYAFVAARLLAFCANSPNGSLAHARQLFCRIPFPTAFQWNTMIRACSLSHHPEESLCIYIAMRRRDVLPNMHTFPVTLRACACYTHIKQIHGQVLRFGFDADVFVVSSMIKSYAELGGLDFAFRVFDLSSNKNVVCWTSLISGCCARGDVYRARLLFEEMPERNDSSWSAVIKGHVQNELHIEAIELFRLMKGSYPRVKPSRSVLVSVLAACSALGSSSEVEWIEKFVKREGLGYGLELGTALIDFYAKSGRVDDARRIFDRMPERDVTTWTAMIMGLAINGQSRVALHIFSQMLLHKISPNSVTFIGILSACNHGGLVTEGWENFRAMSEIFGISPAIEHYSCMVDLLSRAGNLVAAAQVIAEMPMEPDGAIWGSLLQGCMSHGLVGIGEDVGYRVIEVEPGHGGRYVGLANVLAATGRWESAATVRKMMRDRHVVAESGWSSIETDGTACRFLAGYCKQPEWEAMRSMLCDLNRELDNSS